MHIDRKEKSGNFYVYCLRRVVFSGRLPEKSDIF